MRAFVAIELPETVRNELRRLQQTLGTSKADVKWVEMDNFHLTLKFLDEIDAAGQERVEKILNGFRESQKPFELGIKGVGGFPSLEQPRVIWVGLEQGLQTVAALAQKLEADTAAAGFRQEKRPFAGHITLGRMRSGHNRQALTQVLQSAAAIWQSPQPWTVASLSLYESQLSSKGPAYRAISRVNLARVQLSHDAK